MACIAVAVAAADMKRDLYNLSVHVCSKLFWKTLLPMLPSFDQPRSHGVAWGQFPQLNDLAHPCPPITFNADHLVSCCCRCWLCNVKDYRLKIFNYICKLGILHNCRECYCENVFRG